jgi:methyl-accepting chemotaxis protein WspA
MGATLTIRSRILVSFAAVLLMMIITSGIAYWQLSTVGAHARAVQKDSLPGLDVSAQLLSAWTNERALVLEEVLKPESAAARSVDEQLLVNKREIARLTKAYEDTIFQQADRDNYAAFKILVDQYRGVEDNVLSLSRNGRAQEARALAEAQYESIFARLRAGLQGVFEFNKKAVDASATSIVGAVTVASIGIGVSLAVALLLAWLCGLLLLRAITRPLGELVSAVDRIGQGDFSSKVTIDRADEFGRLGVGVNRMIDDLTGLIGDIQKSTIQVNTSITEVAATSKQQQTTASEIAATTSEIGATSKEIASTSRELVRTMDEVSGVADQTADLAGTGQASLSRMDEMMREVVEAAGAINTKLGLLNEKAANVTQVVTTITKVADQTNLLSLNASIEAEKAGEHGRGFAVVATEIRRLADQTAVATYDIEQMVKDIQSAVSAGVVGMDKFSETVRVGMREVREVGGQLSEIVTQVQGLAPRFEAVNEGMQAQATGAVQISEALGQLGEVATQTVEALRQSDLAVEGLNGVSNALRESVSRFRLR